MDRAAILEVLRQFQQELGVRHGIVTLGLFGSAARDCATEGSDVDIVISLRKPNLFTLSRIKLELEERLHTPVDIICYRQRMNPFLKERIEHEACYV